LKDIDDEIVEDVMEEEVVVVDDISVELEMVMDI
jgi:hypothetical protein